MLNHPWVLLQFSTLGYTGTELTETNVKCKMLFFTCGGTTSSGQKYENNQQFVANIPVHGDH